MYNCERRGELMAACRSASDGAPLLLDARIEDGAVVGIGRHDELLQTCPHYAEIYYSQFEKEGE